MTKPEGSLRAAEEQLFWLVALCVPYWQTVLFAGMSGMMSFVLLTLLLLFVVDRSPAIHRAIASLLGSSLQRWLAPVTDRRDHWVSTHLQVVGAGPSLSAWFQRPPPLFS